MLVSVWVMLCGSALAGFDSSGWRFVKDIQVPDKYAARPVAICLESEILEHCLPDLRDLRLVSSDGSLVPLTITPTVNSRDAELIPAQVYRVTRKAGKWTDIWVDKSAKVLTRGVRILTRSNDFIRNVEVRGADSSQEAYVIRLDGLILDQSSPLPVRCDRVFHPLNNFQYLQIRIMDGDAPPLKIDGVSCYPPLPEGTSEQPLSSRIIENRVDKASGSTIVAADLGSKRFPVSHISVETSARDFVKGVRVLGGYSLSAESWLELTQRTIFRITRDEASSDDLEIHLKPTPVRYLKLEFTGGKPTGFAVAGIAALGTVQLMVFQPTPGSSYQLYYGNPSAKAVSHSSGPNSFNVADLTGIAREMVIGPVRRNVPPPALKPANQEKEAAPFAMGKALGVIMLLIGLLLLFSVMLRARSIRRRGRQRNSRILNTPR